LNRTTSATALRATPLRRDVTNRSDVIVDGTLTSNGAGVVVHFGDERRFEQRQRIGAGGLVRRGLMMHRRTVTASNIRVSVATAAAT